MEPARRFGLSLCPMKDPLSAFDALTPALLLQLRSQLEAWYAVEARPLPWREDVSPYHTLLSEIILQQTRVDQGMAYYHRFVERFPTIEALAEATEDEVLLLWQGLGYYSRGRNLRKAAQIIVSDFGGHIPDSPEELAKLPGIGPYTRGAILSFAYHKPYPAVDGNVYRVLSRLFALDTPIDTTRGQRLFFQLAERLVDPSAPSAFNQGLIELGALVCTPRKPQCLTCPLAELCQVHLLGLEPESLPVKQGKTKVRPRHMYYFLIHLRGEEDTTSLFIRRRGEGDIWAGLYELPLIESGEEALSEETLLQHPTLAQWLAGLVSPRLHASPLATRTHLLSHRRISASLYLIEAEGIQEALPFLLIPETERKAYAFPTLIEALLARVG